MFLPLGDDVDKRSIPMIGTLLIMANVLVFAYEYRLVSESTGSRPEELIQFVRDWGLVPLDVQYGNYQGFVTYMFLHGGLMHLLGNMIVLWAFVQTLENALGTVSFLIMYLLWGVVAGLSHFLANGESNLPMVGASGAIAGMIGAYFIAFGAMTKIKTLIWFAYRPWRVDIPAGAFVGFWMISQLLGLAGEDSGQEAGVAWYAHIGGFVAGAATMLIAGKTDQRLIRNRHGELVFVEQGAGAADPTPQTQVETTKDPDACPHCATAFRAESRIAANLRRCPNPACERLTFDGDIDSGQ